MDAVLLRAGAAGLTPDLRHRFRRLDETGLVDEVTFLLAPDSGLAHTADVVVGHAGTHQVTQRRLMQREEAGSQAAFSGEPDTVARGAERLADRGDETHPAGRSIGDLEPRRGSGPRVGDRDQRKEVFDLLLDAQAG